MDLPSFDPRTIPSSSPAAWLSLTGPTPTAGTAPGLYLRSCHAALEGEAFRVQLLGAEAVDPQCTADAGGVTGTAEGVSFQAAWTDDGGCRLRAVGGGLRLTMQHLAGFAPVIARLDARRVQAVIPALNRQFALTAMHGEWRIDAPWRTDRCTGGVLDVQPVDGVAEVVVRDLRSSWPAADAEPPIAELARRRRAEFAAFAAALPALPTSEGCDAAAHAQACYLLWSCIAPPRGRVLRPTVLMSKAWMNRVWSWDHCFNALALAPGHPELAWHQMMAFADHQDADGCFLDCFNPGSEIWEFVKPPVHGWCVQRLMEWADPGTARLRELYEPLARWTRWWLNVRDHAGLGLPFAHHGNDTGADNSTLFDLGVPLATPDLAAYLVLQLECLAQLGERLGRRWDARMWQEEAARLRTAHLLHHWADGDPAPLAADGTRLAQRGDALQPWLAGVLGERLPPAHQARVVAAVPRFRCSAGLASERLGSALHTRDGYWRGPSWAPWNLLLCDGLRRMGRGDLAGAIAHDALRTGARHGFAENFAADDGAPLRDRAYTWTASVHLVFERLAAELGRPG